MTHKYPSPAVEESDAPEREKSAKNRGKEDPRLLPSPQTLVPCEGHCKLPGDLSVHFEAPCAFTRTIKRELRGREAAGAETASVAFSHADNAPKSLQASANRDEGYALAINSEAITIWAATDAGHLYGALTLRQLTAQFGRKLQCLQIADHPTLARRGIQLCFPQGHTVYRHSCVTHMVKQLARQKMNELYFYLESFFDFPSLPGMAGPGAMTPDHSGN